MSDRMPAEMEIGGNLPRSLVDDLLGAIANQGATINWDACPTSHGELVAAAADRGGHLFLCKDEASYGAMEELEDFCREHGLPFNRSSDAKYEYDGETIMFRPGLEDRLFNSTQDGHLLVSAEALEQALAAAGDGNATAAAEELREVMGRNVPPLPPFRIVDDEEQSDDSVRQPVS